MHIWLSGEKKSGQETFDSEFVLDDNTNKN